MNETLLRILQQVREHDQSFGDLQKSHHFTFCLPYGKKNKNRKVLLMGFNPGETPHDWRKTDGLRAEESFLINFNDTNPSPSAKRWFNNIDFFIPNSEILITEFIFWSSRNILDLENRIGRLDSLNPHVKFCSDVNRQIISVFNPNLVVFTGLSHADLICDIFGLADKKDVFSDSNKRVAIEATGLGKKWIFCRHWTGSFGFSTNDRLNLKNIISYYLD